MEPDDVFVEDPYDQFDNDQDAYNEFGGERLDDYGDDPYAPPRRRGKPKRSKTGKRGGNTSLAGMGLLLIGWSIIAIAMGSFVLVGGFLSRSQILMSLGGIAGLTIFIVAGICSLIGHGLCITTPQQTGARGLAIAATTCFLLQYGSTIARSNALRYDVEQNSGLDTLSLVALVSSIAFFILFALFLRQMAVSIKRPDIATQSMIVLWSWPALSVVAFGILYVAARSGSSFYFVFFLFVLLGIVVLALIVLYVSILLRLGFALRR